MNLLIIRDYNEQKPSSNQLMLKRKAEWEFCDHVIKKSGGLNFFIKIFFPFTSLSTTFLYVVFILSQAVFSGQQRWQPQLPKSYITLRANNPKRTRKNASFSIAPTNPPSPMAKRMRDSDWLVLCPSLWPGRQVK